jgi:hypothetical protein
MFEHYLAIKQIIIKYIINFKFFNKTNAMNLEIKT